MMGRPRRRPLFIIGAGSMPRRAVCASSLSLHSLFAGDAMYGVCAAYHVIIGFALMGRKARAHLKISHIWREVSFRDFILRLRYTFDFSTRACLLRFRASGTWGFGQESSDTPSYCSPRQERLFYCITPLVSLTGHCSGNRPITAAASRCTKKMRRSDDIFAYLRAKAPRGARSPATLPPQAYSIFRGRQRGRRPCLHSGRLFHAAALE